MGLYKLIILFGLIWLVFTLYKRYQSSSVGSKSEKPAMQGGKMVRCEVCNTHIPVNEAIEENNHFFCSQAHLDDYKP